MICVNFSPCLFCPFLYLCPYHDLGLAYDFCPDRETTFFHLFDVHPCLYHAFLICKEDNKFYSFTLVIKFAV